MLKQPSILVVTTSHRQLGNSGLPTGLWLEELAVPYYLFLKQGAKVTIASIKGGAIPIDPRSQENSAPIAVKRFLKDSTALDQIQNSIPIAQINIDPYNAVFLPGGHGTMWDFPGNPVLARFLGCAYDQGKIIGAVCHGPAGLIGVRDHMGKSIIAGKRLTAFTDEEEESVGLAMAVPFLLETHLKELCARFEGAPKFTEHVVRDGNIITGQNPASSALTAKTVCSALEENLVNH